MELAREVMDVGGRFLGGGNGVGCDPLLQTGLFPPPAPEVLVEDVPEDREAPRPEFAGGCHRVKGL